jgi:hypothetical protein
LNLNIVVGNNMGSKSAKMFLGDPEIRCQKVTANICQQLLL